MLVPGVAARVKESCDFVCFGVDTGEICTLVRVTAFTRQGEIAGIVISAVLTWNNMFKLECGEWEIFL
jgi:hypothetical protein